MTDAPSALAELRLAVQTSAANDVVVLDVQGEPSVMVRIPKFRMSEVVDGGSDEVHPAFVVGGREVEEIWISKYENCVRDGLAYSLPAVVPAGGISFDGAVAACEGKGPGWHLMTNAEWAAIALWCQRNGTLPYGNDHEGRDHRESVASALPVPGGAGPTLTGTGPLRWTHDGTSGGIRGLRGNDCELVGGVRTVRGEIQVIPGNDAATGVDQAAASDAWRAVLPDGRLVAPGTAGTLRYVFSEGGAGSLGHGDHSFAGGVWTVGTDPAPQADACSFCEFAQIAAAPGVEIPEVLVALALFPAPGAVPDGKVFINAGAAEKIFNRAEAYNTSPGTAGMFYFSSNGDRDREHPNIGFRSAYLPDPSQRP
ncbi:hypothetical protein [Microbacterium sp.]|uniref:hypothetical protein n=1 Tax=Microbacterium sp. TaxID=51671 RepID=UPI0039E24CFE